MKNFFEGIFGRKGGGDTAVEKELRSSVFGGKLNGLFKGMCCRGIETEEDLIKFFEREICEWKSSDKRAEQLTGQRYYEGYHDIKYAQRTAIGAGGRITVIDNLPNNRITDNQYAKAVEQKINYILGNPIVINTENKEYSDMLNYIFDKCFLKMLKDVCRDSLNCGTGWIYIYYDEKGELSFKRFRPWEILPVWHNDECDRADFIIRVYNVCRYDGKIKRIFEKVEIYSTEGIWNFILDGGKLIPENENFYKPYIVYCDSGKTAEYNWDKIPIVPFRYNSEEIPLIRYCKEIQDCINTMLSDFANRLQEDCRNTILVLKNYDGTDLGEFRRNLAAYGAVKVRSADGAQGGVETLTVNVNAENYSTVLGELRNALTENARCFDSRDNRLSGSPNEMSIQSIYSEMDLDGNGMEVEFQSAFDRLLWFVDMHILNIGKGNFEKNEVTVTFSRNILMNEGDVIENIKNSVGIISNETLIAHHPYVNNVDYEIKMINAERLRVNKEPMSST